jgi:hypothetical protein
MKEFALGSHRFDLAYILLGSLYVATNDQFLDHLDSVARILRRGSLYLLDGVVRFNILAAHKERWTITRRGISVRTTYQPELLDPLKQTCVEHVITEVNDHGKRMTFDSGLLRKPFFPQEFLLLVKLHKKLEFVGWFMNFNFNKPATALGRPIVILRKQ